MSQPAPPDSPPAAAPPSPPVWRVALFALLALGLLTGLPYVRGVPPLVGTITATVLFLLLTLLVIREAAQFRPAPLADACGLVACLGLWHATGLWAEYLKQLRPVLGAAEGLLFLGACVFFGRLLSLIVRERNMMLPVAVIAGLADIFTVFFGPTGEALEHVPSLVQKLSVGIPQIGSATGAQGGAGLSHIATAGLGDFVFLTFFLVGVCRFGLRARGTFWAIFGVTLVGMAGVLLLPRLPAAPLLPFIVTGFLIANAGAFALTRTEKLHTAIAIVFFAVLMAVAALLMHRL
ncbi:MAG: hypothetical protein KKI08_00155 [Armatimonadetes bacterium]|nr:hypothetical protein [Armatimonadota bacterium]